MFATIHRLRPRPEDGTRAGAGPVHPVPHQEQRPAGRVVLESPGGPDGAVLSCWDTAEEAGAAVAATSEDVRRPEARVYRVVDVFTGAAAGEQPRQAQLIWFGPTDQHRADARDRAGRERLWPAVARVPGVVWTVVLRGDDGSSVVVGLGVDDGTAEAVQAAVMGTALLPWEDPAHLTGPDRVEVHRVRSAQLPAWTTAGVSR